MIKIKNKEELDRFINGEGIKCLKFGALWCSPCRALENTIKSLTLKETDGVEFAEIDVDEVEEELLDAYAIRNIPVMVYFKDGLVANKTVGLVTKQQLLNNIEDVKNK